jgi:hypothetical protein
MCINNRGPYMAVISHRRRCLGPEKAHTVRMCHSVAGKHLDTQK